MESPSSPFRVFPEVHKEQSTTSNLFPMSQPHESTPSSPYNDSSTINMNANAPNSYNINHKTNYVVYSSPNVHYQQQRQPRPLYNSNYYYEQDYHFNNSFPENPYNNSSFYNYSLSDALYY